MIITLKLLDSIAHLFDIFSRQNANRLCLGLSLWLFVSIPWILLLKNDLTRHKKFLKEYAPPAFDIDAAEDYEKGWNEAGKHLKE